MAIIQTYRRISLDQLDRLRAAPEPAAAAIPEAVAWMLEEDEPALVALVDEPEPAVGPAVESVADTDQFSIDSYWQALHFLLTGEPEGGPLPLRNAVLGGTPLADPPEDPAAPRWLTPEEVSELADALVDIPLTDLEAVYDPADFNKAGIYPARPPERWGWDDLGPLLDRFEGLVRFVRETAGLGQGLLLTRASYA